MELNSSQEKAVQAILYGQSCAKRLKTKLDHPMADIGPVSGYDLAKSILDCFTNAIGFLTDKPKSEDYQFSDLSSMDSSPPPPHQAKHSKKRKLESTNSSENRRYDSADPIHYDGYLWRKYGQKYIKKSDHQRSYYRCSYNCGARKHEQKIKDNPPLYRTTYFGHHTCNAEHNLDVDFTGVQDHLDGLKSTSMIRFGKDFDQKKESYSKGLSFSVKLEEDIIKKKTMDDQYREITGDDQDYCQHVIGEDLSSQLGSCPPPSLSSESESCSDQFNSDLLLDNLDSWDCYDQFYFGF